MTFKPHRTICPECHEQYLRPDDSSSTETCYTCWSEGVDQAFGRPEKTNWFEVAFWAFVILVIAALVIINPKM